MPIKTLFIGLLIFTTLSGCGKRDNHDHPNLQTGNALFNHHCAECHGKDGTGKLADQTPANILTQKGRQGIVSYITTNTHPGRKMPVFATMPHHEASLIADHLIELKRAYASMPAEKRKNPALLIQP